MLIHVEHDKGHKDRQAMLSPGLLKFPRAYWRAARPAGLLFPAARQTHACIRRQGVKTGGKPKIDPISAHAR